MQGFLLLSNVNLIFAVWENGYVVWEHVKTVNYMRVTVNVRELAAFKTASSDSATSQTSHSQILSHQQANVTAKFR